MSNTRIYCIRGVDSKPVAETPERDPRVPDMFDAAGVASVDLDLATDEEITAARHKLEGRPALAPQVAAVPAPAAPEPVAAPAPSAEAWARHDAVVAKLESIAVPAGAAALEVAAEQPGEHAPTLDALTTPPALTQPTAAAVADGALAPMEGEQSLTAHSAATEPLASTAAEYEPADQLWPARHPQLPPGVLESERELYDAARAGVLAGADKSELDKYIDRAVARWEKEGFEESLYSDLIEAFNDGVRDAALADEVENARLIGVDLGKRRVMKHGDTWRAAQHSLIGRDDAVTQKQFSIVAALERGYASGWDMARSSTTKVPAKYRNPETGESWSGRGLKPRWLVAALESGRELADFEVAA